MVPSNYLFEVRCILMRTYQGLHVPLIPWKHHFFFLNLFVTVPFNSGDISPSFPQINCNNVPYFMTWMILFACSLKPPGGRHCSHSARTRTAKQKGKVENSLPNYSWWRCSTVSGSVNFLRFTVRDWNFH